MEPNFQTSFIPKRPIVKDRAVAARSVGFFTVVSIFILFTIILSTIALFFYRGIIKKNIANMENTLNLAKNRFEPSKITELKLLDRRLKASSEILSKHVAITPIFQALQAITMKTVRYTKFSYNLGDEKDPKIIIQMSGLAVGYRSVALQSDLFAGNKNLIDPVFSNLALNDQGNVLFDLEFSVDPSFVDYQAMLKASS